MVPDRGVGAARSRERFEAVLGRQSSAGDLRQEAWCRMQGVGWRRGLGSAPPEPPRSSSGGDRTKDRRSAEYRIRRSQLCRALLRLPIGDRGSAGRHALPQRPCVVGGRVLGACRWPPKGQGARVAHNGRTARCRRGSADIRGPTDGRIVILSLWALPTIAPTTSVPIPPPPQPTPAAVEAGKRGQSALLMFRSACAAVWRFLHRGWRLRAGQGRVSHARSLRRLSALVVARDVSADA